MGELPPQNDVESYNSGGNLDMTTNRPLRVFLCHSSADKPAVRELYQKLRVESWIQPWLDEEELFPGMDWNMEIEKAIEATDVILVCLSNNSITKEGYVQREIRIALDYADYKPEGTLFIIPIRLEDCVPPKRLARWQYADYFEGQRERGFERLSTSLERRANSLELNLQKEIQPFIEKKTAATKPQTNKLKKSEKITPKIDPLFEECVKFAQERGQISAAMIKSKMRIGYTRASQILFTMEREGVIGPAEGEMQIHNILNPISKPAQASLVSQNKLTLSNGMEFMRVPAGKFLMGSTNENKSAYDNESPQHIVDIPYDYLMARFPITNVQFTLFTKHVFEKSNENHPVFNVSWEDSMAYCKWLNGLLKAETLSGLVLRLPTEAEWEKAARGVEAFEYPWGNTFDENKCNTSEGGKGNKTPVGLYSPQGDSPYGCADMSGNIWEWTHSLFKPYPYRISDGREDENAFDTRVLRGGSYFTGARSARCACRTDSLIGNSNSVFGFRVVMAPSLRGELLGVSLR